MRITDRGPGRAAPLPVPDDDFEAVRVAFCERLKGERLRLLDLSATLAYGQTDRRLVLDELRNRAHRMSGTAAIFELCGVAALARAVELAAEGVRAGAAAPRAENSDRVLYAALHALTCVISSLDEPARALQVHDPIQAPRRSRTMLNG
jgi:Hpt domain